MGRSCTPPQAIQRSDVKQRGWVCGGTALPAGKAAASAPAELLLTNPPLQLQAGALGAWKKLSDP